MICANMQNQKTLSRESPLASRLRPTTLDEVVGKGNTSLAKISASAVRSKLTS